jgi:hypothetical protein
MTVFNERVRELRPAYLPPDPAGRTTYDAGDIVQCDLWFRPTTIPVGYGADPPPNAVAGADDGAGVYAVAGISRCCGSMNIASRADSPNNDAS